MFWLILSIVTNTALLLILKSFPKFRINTLQGIVANYFTASALGFLLCTHRLPVGEMLHLNWSWVPPIMGLLFISIFLLLARTAQTIGVSVATIANKMSLVIPVTLAVILYHEQLEILQWAGLVIALIAVILSSLPPEKSNVPLGKHLLLPAIVFIGSGIIDALVNHAKKLPIPDEQLPLFISCCFAIAFAIGTSLIIFRVTRGKDKFEVKSVYGGIVLGIPNYFSIYGITRALGSDVMKSSALYPVNNMGIVALSAIAALIIFKEKFSSVNWIGILLSIAAIALIAFGD